MQKSSSRRKEVRSQTCGRQDKFKVSRGFAAISFQISQKFSRQKKFGIQSFGLFNFQFPDWFENLIEEDQNFGIHVDLQIQCLKFF